MKRQSHVRSLGFLLMMVVATVSSEAKPQLELSMETVAELERARNFAHEHLFEWNKQPKIYEANAEVNAEVQRARGNKRKQRKGRRRDRNRVKMSDSNTGTTSNIMNGIKTVTDIMEEGRDFFRDSQRFDVRSERIPYHSGLAAGYGTLTSETVITMDDFLKAAIASTNRLMKRLQRKVDHIGSEIPFDKYLGIMHQNVLIKKKENTEIVKSDVLSFEDLNWFKFDGSPEKKKVMQVLTWFTNLINDTDVLKDTKIDIEDLANIVAATGAAVSDFATLFYAKEYIERSIVDVGILRYPDPMHPFFKLYRIQIFAYRKSTRVLATQKDEAGIKGDYECVQFVPRPTVLRKISKEIMSKAVNEAESMFD